MVYIYHFIFLCFFLTHSLATNLQNTKPSFIFLLLDDVGWGDVNVGLGNYTPAQTPNLRAMSEAPGSVVFSRFLIGGSVCSPTRSSILTGRTPTRECIINVEQNALPAVLNQSTTAAYCKSAGYSTGFFGKWHLGSLTDQTIPDCYSSPPSNCTTGYIPEKGNLCCDGRDAHVPVATPLDFGFDVVLATSQVSPSATANCGCAYTVPGAGKNCELGHYAGAGHIEAHPWLECDQYLSTPGITVGGKELPTSSISNQGLASVQVVTPVDDAAFLTDALVDFIKKSVTYKEPFYAQVSFHQTHIPYIAPPEFRMLYPNLTKNEQDYYGALSAVDAQVGRIRALLRSLAIEQDTFIVVTSDNGPENSVGGHDCAAFPNPGSNGGLTGRKRSLTEGGIRVPGIIEYPRLIKSNFMEPGNFPVSSMDFLPTLIDLLNQSPPKWPIDGVTLIPFLSGTVSHRPPSQPIGHYSDFPWVLQHPSPIISHCSARNNNIPPPSFNLSGFKTPFSQEQFSWNEGNLKLFACNPPDEKGKWRFSLYDVVKDPKEKNDLWEELRDSVGDEMFRRFLVWQESVFESINMETRCSIGV